MSEFDNEAPLQYDEDVCRLCSYAVSGNSSIHQAIYRCETCNPDSDQCCCVGCMNVCHQGHDVTFVAFGDGYCDCGHSGCSMYEQSKEVASRLLDNNFHVTNPLLLEPIKEYKEKFTIHHIKNFTQESPLLVQQALHLVSVSKDTFWINHSEQPRCLFEELAKFVGSHHMKHQYGYLPHYNDLLSITGYEWWVQVKPNNDGKSVSVENSVCPGRGVLGVDLHYDKDEEMAAMFEVGIFPLISTVTYVTNSEEYCHPTVVYDCFASTPVGNPIRQCFISFPEVGKHVAFDGRLLHGAPSELLSFVKTNRGDSSSTATDELRVTFLVNVWVGHRPSAVVQISQSVVNSLNVSRQSWCEGHNKVSGVSAIELISLDGYFGKTVRVQEQDTQRDDLGDWITIPFVSNKAEWGKSENEAGLDLSMWLPNSVDQYIEMSNGKGKKRKANNNDIASEEKGPWRQTFHFEYIGENAAARLDYEDDEGEADLAEEFEDL